MDSPFAPPSGPPQERTGLFKFLDVASAKLDSLRAPSPNKNLASPDRLEEPPSASLGRTSQRSRSSSRSGATVVEIEPSSHHVKHGSDEGEKDDVIRLLKQCLAAAQQEEEHLKLQLAQQQKEVEYWKAESYGGISKSLGAIATSPQYLEIKEKLKQEKARSLLLEKQLADSVQKENVAVRERDEMQKALEASRIDLEKQKEEHQRVNAVLRDEVAAAKAKIESLETALKRAYQEAEDLRKSLNVEMEEQARDNVLLREEVRAARAELQTARAEAETARTLLSSRQHHVGSEGGGEFQCLLRDRELLATQLGEAQQQLKAIASAARSGTKEGNQRVVAPLPPVVEVLPVIVPEATSADIALQNRFKLPQGERQIAMHGCTFAKQAHGFLYLFHEHLCFGPSAVKSFYDQHDLVIPLVQIAAIDKSGSTTHVRVLLKDGTVHDFSGIKHRKVFAVQVRSASARCGTAVEILRDGIEDLKSGILPDLKEDDFIVM